MTMVILSANSYHRMASKHISRISDWQEVVRESYELRTVRPTIKPINLENDDAEAEGKESHQNQPLEMKDHRGVKVQSVIDVHTWDQARWQGAAYAQSSPTQPPYMAFLFGNAESAKKVFERWRERFGNEDKNEEIYLSIIRQLPEHNTHHYCVLVTSRIPDTAELRPGQILSMTTKSLMMEPDSDINPERFLESYRHFRAFYLLPAILNGTSSPELLFDHAILKRDLTVKLAADVSEHDVEAIALRIRETS